MAEPAALAGVMRFPGAAQRTEVTVSETQLYHYITDEELERIGEMRKEPVMEICLAASGVFFGTLLPAVDQVARFNASQNPMGLVGLFTCFLAVGSLFVAIVTALLWYQRAGIHRGMLATIRGRNRVAVEAD